MALDMTATPETLLPDTLLSVRGLNVVAGDRPILTDISFDLAPRSILSVIGATGSGKTVLARALASWLSAPLRVTGGEIRFRGRDLVADPAHARNLAGREIAYVGGNPAGALDPTMTVGAQLVEKLRAVRPDISADAARQKAIRLLEAVHIPSAARRFHEYPFQYSGGMMQRAMIVDALISDPALLIADNITQPLDVTVAAQILKLMRELNSEFSTAILFICSSLPVACDASDEVMVLHEGRVVERQTPAALVAGPEHSYTRALIAELPTLWQDGQTGAGRDIDRNRRAIMSVRGLAKAYEVRARGQAGVSRVQAVRNVEFDVFPGDNFGVVGESGCGKSSLMRLLTGLERPDAGSVFFEGENVAAASPRRLRELRRRFQLVLQDPYGCLPPQSAIGAILEEPLKIHRIGNAAERRDRARAVMAEVGLDDSLYRSLPTGLSAGQRQRLNVARAMILEPRLLIMDETLSALDQTEQGKLLDLFDKLQAQHGFTYIFISHDLTMVRQVCSRIAVMYLGETVEVAPNERLFFDPGHPYSRALLSAAPTLEERRYRPEDCLLEGEPPSPIDLPPGCAFASRCPQAFERCRAENPALRARGGHALAACFLNPEPDIALPENALHETATETPHA
ncbi:ABC transporter ATP-binding protein [Rhodovulum sulfidophilum]|uniref:ABC transporter ATP-binding protein n=1 Tax=Rhodovulum sulfidophilum TaxID=35806 RepID=UPI000951FE1D|nr:ABC transporter ATP-binding protein [Rhodovulum sulfidophilum]MBL3551797.1 ABC transporter ATP-binding protein [Rhodovulum sulfidophilum]OLS47118.1 glutathione ABC transporter ATP-binding protein [Rhodovulum sulfidophilum]